MRRKRSDAGRKHSRYDMTIRRFKREMNVLSKMLGQDDETRYRVAKTRKERRSAARKENLPADLICPVCTEFVLESSRWVVREGSVMCRSCWKLKKENDNV